MVGMDVSRYCFRTRIFSANAYLWAQIYGIQILARFGVNRSVRTNYGNISSFPLTPR